MALQDPRDLAWHLFTTGKGSDLVVDLEGTHYDMHQRFVCAGSLALARSYRPDALGAATGSIRVRGEEHEVVENILRHLYGLPVYFNSDKQWAIHDAIKLIGASRKYRLPKLPAATEEALVVYIDALTEEYHLVRACVSLHRHPKKTLISAETRKWLVTELVRDLHPIMRNEDAWDLLLKYPELLRTAMTYLAKGSDKVTQVADDGRTFEWKQGASVHKDSDEESGEGDDSDYDQEDIEMERREKLREKLAE